MRILILTLLGCVLVLGVLLTGWAIEDAGVHLPGEGTPHGPISSPTAAFPR